MVRINSNPIIPLLIFFWDVAPSLSSRVRDFLHRRNFVIFFFGKSSFRTSVTSKALESPGWSHPLISARQQKVVAGRGRIIIVLISASSHQYRIQWPYLPTKVHALIQEPGHLIQCNLVASPYKTALFHTAECVFILPKRARKRATEKNPRLSSSLCCDRSFLLS